MRDDAAYTDVLHHQSERMKRKLSCDSKIEPNTTTHTTTTTTTTKDADEDLFADAPRRSTEIRTSPKLTVIDEEEFMDSGSLADSHSVAEDIPQLDEDMLMTDDEFEDVPPEQLLGPGGFAPGPWASGGRPQNQRERAKKSSTT